MIEDFEIEARISTERDWVRIKGTFAADNPRAPNLNFESLISIAETLI